MIRCTVMRLTKINVAGRCIPIGPAIRQRLLAIIGLHSERDVKLNTGASYISKTGESWIGAVARDHRGQVFVAVCQKLNKCSSVEEAEAEAALIGPKELANCIGGWSLWKSTALLSARNCIVKDRTERSVSLWWQTLIKPLPSLLTAP